MKQDKNNILPQQSNFDSLKQSLNEKKARKIKLLKELSTLKNEIKKEETKLHSICNHSYEKRLEYQGCYSSSYQICIHCGKYS